MKALLGLAVGAVLVAATPDPVPVRLVLDHDVYTLGQHGVVRVDIGADGYLFVLHAEPDGHVRVAFPLDPGDSAVVHAGDHVSITARGAPPGESFTVEDSLGGGIWYAAISAAPFHIDSIVRGDHWDYRVFPVLGPDQDPESQLTDFVGHAASEHFDYDIVGYRVVARDSTVRPVSTQPAATPPPGGPAPPADDDPPWAFPRFPHGVRLDAVMGPGDLGAAGAVNTPPAPRPPR